MQDFDIKISITDATGKYVLFLVADEEELFIVVRFLNDASGKMFVISDVDVWTAYARKPAFLSPGFIRFTDMDGDIIEADCDDGSNRTAEMTVTIRPKDKKLYEEAISLLLDYDVDVEFV